MLSELRIFFAAVLVSFIAVFPVSAQTQAETLEDLRLDISALSEVMQDLRNELLATGNSGVSQDSVGDILQRLNTLEGELSAALGLVETLEFRVVQIADDAARRIGDLEFRLTELEGGDTNALGTTVPLGGASGITDNTPQLASDEQRSFNMAVAFHDAGQFQASADQYMAFITTYPGGPLTSEAQYRRGVALAGLQDWGTAARSFLDSFSGTPDGPFAAVSLYELSVSLGALGQTDQACLTLDEIAIRYGSVTPELTGNIAIQKQTLACP